MSALQTADQIGLGAPTLVECAIVLAARVVHDPRGMLARFLEEAQITVAPYTERHFGMAMNAWIKYGRGRHPAALNFGDCLAYDIARQTGMLLLCLGDEFPQTDLDLA